MASVIYINGKFTAQVTTGVQRVSTQLVQALDEQLVTSTQRWVLLCPSQGVAPALKHIEVRHVGPPWCSLHAWEQSVLPWAARNGLLLNLSGSAPALKRQQVCLFHDAAVFDHPEAYKPAFVAWYRAVFKLQARLARRVLTVSEFSKQRLMHHLALPEHRIGVVRNGAEQLLNVMQDDTVLTRLGLTGQAYFLAVGSRNPTKNQAALVAAFNAVRADLPVRLVIVGSCNDAVFTNTATPQGARIQYAADVTDGQLKALYRHAQALVFPSIYEGCGLPPLEAMSLGCPVLAARAAAIPEMCADAALYFDPLRVADITAAIERFIIEPGLAQHLRERGEVRVRTLTWSAAAQALLQQIQPVQQP
jgi:glycosyltransferase involved in cell wall biosynthesis